MRSHSRIGFVMVSLFALCLSMWSQPAAAQTPATRQPAPVKPLKSVPANRPELGLVYDGLVAAQSGPCVGMFQVGKTALCTHGPDEPPLGHNVLRTVAPVQTVAPASVICDGDGVSGKRTQVMYVRASDKPDRYASYLASFRTWASDVDNIYSASALETGADRHVRFVTDSGCTISVLNVVVSPAGDDSIGTTMNELAAKGYNLATRKYLLFVDANILCGVGTIRPDDRNISTNSNDTGGSYARVDSGCWGGWAAAHEHMHNLGGVQPSAPNSSGGWHCVDEYDVMCYSDSPNYPAMQYRCLNTNSEDRFDCNHDDYYHTNPPANSYLATHWNAANSTFLIKNATERTYTLVAVHSNKCVDSTNSSDNGSPIWQWSCHGGTNQKWLLSDAGSGYFYIRSAVSGKCVDSADIYDGSPIWQWTCHGGTNQHWKLIPVGNGANYLQARSSGKCMDVYDLRTDDGAPIHQWSCTGNPNQQFFVR